MLSTIELSIFLMINLNSINSLVIKDSFIDCIFFKYLYNYLNHLGGGKSMDKKELLLKIETKRQELIQVVSNYGLTSPTTIKYSKELDELLNKYDRLDSYIFSK